MSPDTELTVSVPARVHLAGNPSDGYGGAVLSTVVPELTAVVTTTDADRFQVTGPESAWPSIEALRHHAHRFGHDGGHRLVTAALVALDRVLPPTVERTPFAVSWSTSIPRSVGLAGSSALVIATMRSALQRWQAQLTDHDLASVALAAETDELGISAGLADRAVQAHGGTVLTDCREGTTTITPIPVAAPIRVTLCWNVDAAFPSDDYHRQLRARSDAGDPALDAEMVRLSYLADTAAESLLAGDAEGFATAVHDSLTRRQLLGPVPAEALAPVEALRAAGARVNFPGSGGALLIVGDVDPPAGWDSLLIDVR